jgi:PAT family beta-lactamase induction signal transducer AmpG
MLIGTLGRGALGEMIKTDGYADVFILTMWLGAIGIVACALEWWRQSRLGSS